MDSWVALATPVRRVARESTFHKTMDWRFYARNSLDARSLIRLLKFRLLSRSESSSTVPVGGTEGSNPVPSSGESGANRSWGSRRQCHDARIEKRLLVEIRPGGKQGVAEFGAGWGEGQCVFDLGQKAMMVAIGSSRKDQQIVNVITKVLRLEFDRIDGSTG